MLVAENTLATVLLPVPESKCLVYLSHVMFSVQRGARRQLIYPLVDVGSAQPADQGVSASQARLSASY